jgi:adenylate cyclase
MARDELGESPHDPHAGPMLAQLTLAQYHQGNYAEAEALAGRALRRRRFTFVLPTLLASLGQLGKSAEAKDIITS